MTAMEIARARLAQATERRGGAQEAHHRDVPAT